MQSIICVQTTHIIQNNDAGLISFFLTSNDVVSYSDFTKATTHGKEVT